MDYILDFCVISFCFLGVTGIFYARQRRLRTLRTRLYGCLILLGLCSLAFDFLAGAIDRVASLHPLWLLYSLNILFLSCVQLSGPVFLMYTLVLTGRYPRMSRAARISMWLPFAVSAAALAISPLGSRGGFFLDAVHVYQHGDLYLLLYAAMGCYLIASAILVTVNRRRIRRGKRLTIYAFLLLTCVAMLVQIGSPQFLVNTTANALALMIMYFALESPSQHIDPLTRLFNRASLPVTISDLYEQNQSFTVTVFPLAAFHLINYTLGIRRGDDIMIQFARYLERAYPRAVAVRLTGDVYAVVDAENGASLDEAALETALSAIPARWTSDGMEAQLSVSAAGVNSGDYASAPALLDVINTLVAQHEAGEDDWRTLLIDENYRRRQNERAAYEEALERALTEGRVNVFYQPIHDAAGRLVALEALCRISDPTLGNLRPDVFIPIAEKSGAILRLGEQVLSRVCGFVNEYGLARWGLEHIGVNLSVAQCMQTDLVDVILDTVRRADVPHGLLSFEITETAATSSLPVVRQVMQRLADHGFRFLLDDFGSGYANFNYLAELPFHCVKLDHDLLWTATGSDKQTAFLRGLAGMIRRLGLLTVCEGVETEAQAGMLNDMGVDMHQGFLYSRALPPNDLVTYAKRFLPPEAFSKGGDA